MNNTSENERVAVLEANFGFIKETLSEIRSDIRESSERLEGRITILENRIVSVNNRIDRIDHRIDNLIKWIMPTMLAGVGGVAAIIKLIG